MPNGFRGGWGFGFRGSSPPWPFVGLGRGGLPRCGYFLSGASGVPFYSNPGVINPYGASGFPASSGYTPTPGMPTSNPGASFAPGMAPEQELDFLKNQAQMIRNQLSGIESRIEELEEE